MYCKNQFLQDSLTLHKKVYLLIHAPFYPFLSTLLLSPFKRGVMLCYAMIALLYYMACSWKKTIIMLCKFRGKSLCNLIKIINEGALLSMILLKVFCMHFLSWYDDAHYDIKPRQYPHKIYNNSFLFYERGEIAFKCSPFLLLLFNAMLYNANFCKWGTKIPLILLLWWKSLPY